MELPFCRRTWNTRLLRATGAGAAGIGLLAAALYLAATRRGVAKAPAEQAKLIDIALGSDDEAERRAASRQLAELNAGVLKRIKRLRVVITTYSDTDPPVPATLPETARKLLTDSGVAVVDAKGGATDAILRIYACCSPRCAIYGGTVQYTSAQVGGVSVVEVGGRPAHVVTFSSEPNTPWAASVYCCPKPRDAPFEEVFGMALFPPLATILGSRGQEPLIAALGNQHEVSDIRKYWRRAAAVAALGELDNQRAVEALIGALHNKQDDYDPLVEETAIRALGRLKNPRAIEPLIAALGSTGLFGDVAAEALGRSRDPRAFKPLIAALRRDLPSFQAAVARALGEFGDPGAVEPLIALLKVGRMDAPEAAAAALGRLKDSRAVAPLIVVLRDGNWMARKSAAIALGLLQDPRAVEPLIATLKNNRPDIGGRFGIDVSVFVRQAAAEALGRLNDPRALEPLVAALKDDRVEMASAAALARFNDPRGFERLLAQVKNIGPGEIEALGQSKAPEARRLLIIALRDDINDEYRLLAATALGRFDDPQVLEPLVAALRGDSNDVRAVRVREEAATVLGKLKDPRAIQPLRSLLARNCSPAVVTALVRLELHGRLAGGR